MIWSLASLTAGFILDLILGDPHGIPHPVVGIGRLISFFEKFFRSIFPENKKGERLAGLCLWIAVALISFFVPFFVLKICMLISPWVRFAVESIMCWQILAAKSLKTESMKVYYALRSGSIEKARYAVSMIVGRDTASLDRAGIARAAVETVAENTSDGVIAPLIYMAVLGAPLGFLYKGINTMDSMLGYTDPPYTNIGFVPAKADDIANFIPARISALLLLAGGWCLNVMENLKRRTGLPLRNVQNESRISGSMAGGFRFNIRNGWKIFKRDRYKHASPNSAQTESACAGMLGLRLAGDAWYHGVLHKKPYIGDPKREIEYVDIKRTCMLMYASSVLCLVLAAVVKIICG